MYEVVVELDVTQPVSTAVLAGLDPAVVPRLRNYPPLVAKGDGSDATDALQDRLTIAASATGASVYVPSGSYAITRTLEVPPGILTLRGCGEASHLMWSFLGDLFRWQGECTAARIHDLHITATVDDPTASGCAFELSRGAQQVSIARVHVDVDDPTKRWGHGIRLAAPFSPVPGAPFVLAPESRGEIYLDDLQFWRFRGTAVHVRQMTSVHVRGCRFPAIGRPDGSIGLHLAGHTGGVWVTNCDFSELATCILVERSTIDLGRRTFTLPWNRELFLTGGACDASVHGLVIRDRTMVTVTGAWLASCTSENLLVEAGHAPTLEITGGIVFNGGTLVANKQLHAAHPVYRHHGAVILGGEAALSGVMFKNNAGVGLTLGDQVRGYAVNGCVFVDNWALGAELHGHSAAVTGNVFRRNGFVGAAALQALASGSSLQLANNVATDPIDPASRPHA